MTRSWPFRLKGSMASASTRSCLRRFHLLVPSLWLPLSTSCMVCVRTHTSLPCATLVHTRKRKQRGRTTADTHLPTRTHARKRTRTHARTYARTRTLTYTRTGWKLIERKGMVPGKTPLMANIVYWLAVCQLVVSGGTIIDGASRASEKDRLLCGTRS